MAGKKPTFTFQWADSNAKPLTAMEAHEAFKSKKAQTIKFVPEMSIEEAEDLEEVVNEIEYTEATKEEYLVLLGDLAINAEEHGTIGIQVKKGDYFIFVEPASYKVGEKIIYLAGGDRKPEHKKILPGFLNLAFLINMKEWISFPNPSCFGIGLSFDEDYNLINVSLEEQDFESFEEESEEVIESEKDIFDNIPLNINATAFIPKKISAK